MNSPNIYQEKQKTYLILVIIYLIIAAMLLTYIFIPRAFNQTSLTPLVKIFLILVAIIDLLMFWAFSGLTIKLDTESLQIGFGIFKRKILNKNIKDCLVEDYDKSRYLGYGIRIGKDKSIGYIARGGRGVRLKMGERDIYFSTDNAEQLQQLIKLRIIHE